MTAARRILRELPLPEIETLVPVVHVPARTMLPAGLRTEPRASTRPTIVPSSQATWHPSSDTHVKKTEAAPPTQRSASLEPRAEAAARAEAYNLLAVMRMNADFLSTLIDGNDGTVAQEALADLQRGIDRLERRFALSKSVLPRR